MEKFETTPLPDWLTAGDPPEPKLSKEARALSPVQFESVFPRVMNLIANGCTMSEALLQLPIELDGGAFRRWLKKDPNRVRDLEEAEELRSEVWADNMMKHALGFYEMEDVNRSKLVVDSYKFRIGADNRRKYGDYKQVQIGGTISVTAALAAAEERVIQGSYIEVDDPVKELSFDAKD